MGEFLHRFFQIDPQAEVVLTDENWIDDCDLSISSSPSGREEDSVRLLEEEILLAVPVSMAVSQEPNVLSLEGLPLILPREGAAFVRASSGKFSPARWWPRYLQSPPRTKPYGIWSLREMAPHSGLQKPGHDRTPARCGCAIWAESILPGCSMPYCPRNPPSGRKARCWRRWWSISVSWRKRRHRIWYKKTLSEQSDSVFCVIVPLGSRHCPDLPGAGSPASDGWKC